MSSQCQQLRSKFPVSLTRFYKLFSLVSLLVSVFLSKYSPHFTHGVSRCSLCLEFLPSLHFSMIKSYSEFVHLFERKGPNAIATPTKNCCPHLPPGSTAAPCSSPAGAHTGTVTVTQGSLAVTAEASLGWGLTIGILSPDLRRP